MARVAAIAVSDFIRSSFQFLRSKNVNRTVFKIPSKQSSALPRGIEKLFKNDDFGLFVLPEFLVAQFFENTTVW